MGSREQPNHGGSGKPYSRKSRPSPPRAEDIKYGPIKSLAELEVYLSGNKITCLICGSDYKSLGHHLSITHALGAKEYKEMFNIPVTRSLSGEGTKDLRSGIAKKMWSENPLMESVRQRLKDNIHLLDGTLHKSKSSIVRELNAASVKKAKEIQTKLGQAKYREVYLALINKSITENVTLYHLVGTKVFQIYSFARRHQNDSEFIERLTIARKMHERAFPVGVRLRKNGKYEARYSGHSIGTFESIEQAVSARANYIVSQC